MKKDGGRKVELVESAVADSDRPYWVGFHHVPFIGAGRMGRLLDRFGSLEIAWQANRRDLQSVLDERSMNSLIEQRSTLALDLIMTKLERADVRVMTWLDAEYPRLLAQIPSPPPVLFMRGAFSTLDEHAVGIVGTRKMSPYGREVTEAISRGLASAGVTIVSGLASGVDGVAHRAAIAASGRTIAVLGGGIDRVYPQEHRKLARDVIDHGVLMSEYMPDEPADAPHFPARNRIISGLSLGIVVTEAPERSGALITVDFAADQGREVFAVPGNVTAANSAGCHRILRDGARIVRSPEDVLEDLRIGITIADPVQQPLLLDERDRRLIAVLTGDPTHIDDIAALVDLTVSQVSVQLMTLELQGLVRNIGAQNYVRR